MSSTSNAQDLLVNVFRPTYRWDSNTGFVPSMVVSNVSELITGRINTDRLAVTDSNGNSYIGFNAGPALANVTTYSNTAIGVNAMAGASNSSNNVSLGLSNFSGLSNGMCNVGIGAKTLITGTGQENILIGTNITMGDGSGNIIIGNDLSLGNISKTFRLGSLLYGDLSSGFVGINTSKPEAALDISGIVVFRNKVGFQNPNPTYSLDVAGSVFASEQIIGSNGTVANPLFTFKDASGTGMYVPASGAGFGDGAFAIAVNRAPAAVFSSNQVNFYQNLDVSGTFSARGVVLDGFAVQNGTAAVPTMTFENDSSSGLFLVGTDRIGVSTDGLRRMEILPTGDVSMARLVTRDISYSGTIVGTDPTTCNVIGGVTLQNGNVILTGTATNSNLLVPGWIRNTTTGFVLDISGGNISNSLTTRSSNFRASAGTAGVPAYSFASDPSTGVHSAGTSQLAFDTAGVQRMVISNGNVGIGKANPVVALEVVGDVSATTYNGPGGTQGAPHYTFSDDRTTGLFFPGANMIGLTAGGTERMRISNSNIGIGTTAPTNALDVSGTLRVIGTAGDLTFTNGTISLAGVPVISSTGVLSNAASTSNSIGGVTLSNSNVIAGGFLRNALTPSTYDISGGKISNSSTTTSSNFRAISGGAPAGPAYSFTGATQTGMLLNSGFLQFATDGVTRFQTSANTTTVSNQLAVTDGTAAAPGYAFTSDTGLGVFRPGANQLAFATSGSNRMTVLANGNVGIGTTAPSVQLDVSGPGVQKIQVSGQDAAVNIQDQRIVSPFVLYQNSLNYGIYSSNSLPLWIYQNNGLRMVISNGNVGIGTTAPGAALDVSGGVVRVQRIYNGLANAFVIADSTAGSPVARWGVGILNAGTGSGNGGHDFAINAYDDAANILSSALTIKRSNGNVGIGTTAPVCALDLSVSDAVAFRIGRGQACNAAGPHFRVNTSFNSYANVEMNGYFTIMKAGTTDATQPFVSFSPEYRLAGHWLIGNDVGIGTTTPSQQLDVSGVLRVFDNGQDVMGLMDPRNGNYLRIGAWNRAGNSSKDIRLNINGGNVGIGPNTPAHLLDVNGTIRGSSNIVAVTTSNWNQGISFTAFSNTPVVFNIAYTPKQTGTVRLMIHAAVDMYTDDVGSGPDGVILRLFRGGNIIGFFRQMFSGSTVFGRGSSNTYAGGHFAAIDVTGGVSSNINFEIYTSGDETGYYRNAYLSIMEISTI